MFSEIEKCSVAQERAIETFGSDGLPAGFRNHGDGIYRDDATDAKVQ
jgi:hypothetical protein